MQLHHNQIISNLYVFKNCYKLMYNYYVVVKLDIYYVLFVSYESNI